MILPEADSAWSSTSTMTKHRLSVPSHHSTAWKKLSKSYRERNPLCVRCAAGNGPIPEARTVAAQCVDHIKPAWKFPDLFYDESNIQSLCFACHERVTEEDLETYGDPSRKHRRFIRYGPDGYPAKD